MCDCFWFVLKVLSCIVISFVRLVMTGTNDTRTLKTLRPAFCPKNDDKQSDYSEDDKTSSHNEVCGTKNEGHDNNTKGKFRGLDNNFVVV